MRAKAETRNPYRPPEAIDDSGPLPDAAPNAGWVSPLVATVIIVAGIVFSAAMPT